MFLIRSIVQVQPGRRDEAVSLFKEFMADVSATSGGKNGRVLTASVGPSDSTVIMENEYESLAAFEQSLQKANSSDKMSVYMPKFAELGIPGTHRFEIYRIC